MCWRPSRGQQGGRLGCDCSGCLTAHGGYRSRRRAGRYGPLPGISLVTRWGPWGVRALGLLGRDQLTRAPGTVIASSKTKTVQSLSRGSSSRSWPRKGPGVGRGAGPGPGACPTQSAVDEAEAELASLVAARSRLTAEINDTPLAFPESLDQFPEFVRNQGPSPGGEGRPRRRAPGHLWVPGPVVELRPLRPLAVQGDVSESEIIRLERQKTELEGRYRSRNAFYRDAASTSRGSAQRSRPSSSS